MKRWLIRDDAIVDAIDAIEGESEDKMKDRAARYFYQYG